MKIKSSLDRGTAWRSRFLQIAREVEGGTAPRALVVAQGLRLRLRASLAPALRRARPA